MRTLRQFILSLVAIICFSTTLTLLLGPKSTKDYDDTHVRKHGSSTYREMSQLKGPRDEESAGGSAALITKLTEDVAAQEKALKEYMELVKSLNDEVIRTKSFVSTRTDENVPVKGREKLAIAPGTVGSKTGDLNKKSPPLQDDVAAHLKENYVGCYADSFGQRDMPVYLPAFTQYPAKCVTACFARGFKYAGLQDGGECWCGPSRPNQQKLEDGKCDKPCSGDSSKMCGGQLKNSVYKAVDIGLQDDKLLVKRPFELSDAGSSVTCQGHNKDTRVCKFRNLYYDTSASLSKNRIFIFYRGPGTIIVNLDEVKYAQSGEMVEGIMELTSITGIYGLDIRVIDLPTSLASAKNAHDLPYLSYKDVRVVLGSSSLFARFLPFNIMHHMHDDLMNLFMTLVEYSSPHYKSTDVSSEKGEVLYPSAPFDTQTRLVVMDAHGAGGYSSLLQYLSDVPITHITELTSAAENDAKESSLIRGPPSSSHAPRSVLEGGNGHLIQFETAVTSITRHCNWYQYGFSIPQGPLENKEVDGHNVRMFANFLLSRVPPLTRLPASKPLVVYGKEKDDARTAAQKEADLRVTDPEQRYIAIFSRTRNRKILNEPELVEALEAAYPHLKVVIVRLEETPLPVLLRVCEKASIAIGMHGSILMLALFMPKGSLLVELYPYAVPAENYTPYRTLAGLKNMDMKYAAWENNHEENNLAYPNRPRLEGGISHLTPKEKEDVVSPRWVPKHTCCENPTWLYRIYQDTKVHVEEVLDLIEGKGRW